MFHIKRYEYILQSTIEVMNGVELNARYALMPNKLGFCGTKNFKKAFTDYLEGKATAEALEEELRKLHTSFAYLNLIANANKKEPFDLEVVEAYWIGNEFLENVEFAKLQQFFYERLVENEVSKDKADKLANNLPLEAIAHHSFHAFIERSLIETPMSIITTINTMNNCRIGWGQIKEVSDETLKIKSSKLMYNTDKKTIELTVGYEETFHKVGEFKSINEPRIGDWISTHWRLAVQKLDNGPLRDLATCTGRNITALNKLKVK